MNKRVYPVGKVNIYVKRMFDSDYLLKHLFVKGEVSNCKYHSSGHIYFTLKDDEGTLNCVMFRSNQRTGLTFPMTNGQEVIVEGSISLYEREGKYQLYANQITLSGAGDLHARYEALKQKLYEEGLFEFDIKRPICKYPKRVGIVTAKTGAAIEDIKNIAKRRNPYVQLILYPAKVQGDGAAETIVKGIETLDKLGVDTIIIGRGGGSMEDLWAFNEEIVARAIRASHTPIISGTGHEIDNTIADYASDLRAPTPSAACELAIPDVMSTITLLDSQLQQMGRSMSKKVSYADMRLESLSRHLQSLSPKQKVVLQQKRLQELTDKLKHGWQEKLSDRKQRLVLMNAKLDGLSPTAKLKNGFGYISDKADKPVLSAKQVQVGDSLQVTLHDGAIIAQITDMTE